MLTHLSEKIVTHILGRTGDMQNQNISGWKIFIESVFWGLN